MARITVVPIVALRNSHIVLTQTDLTAVRDATKGAKIAYDHNDHLAIIIKNTATSAKDVTILASVDDTAYMKGQGALVVSVGAAEEVVIMGLEQPRFGNIVSGTVYLYLDFATDITGTLVAIQTLPA